RAPVTTHRAGTPPTTAAPVTARHHRAPVTTNRAGTLPTTDAPVTARHHAPTVAVRRRARGERERRRGTLHDEWQRPDARDCLDARATVDPRDDPGATTRR
ncbi:MAG TPA: hypothetical protein VHE35_24520, partial [Kofleriaceae bacterium]|nr:hypothetical protein [Kofleriaceae bacterium]